MIVEACDNHKRCHDPFVIEDNDEAMRVVCKQCWQHVIIRKDPIKKVPLNREYIKFFRKLTLQGNHNLFYKYYPEFLGR